MPLEVVILIGLPASGKTTFYQERYAATHEHVSKDTMRNVAGKETRQARQLAAALAAGRSVVVDNTNASRKERAPLVAAARAHAAQAIGYYFPTDAGAALRRNRLREGRARVPDVAIFTARKRLEPPALDEGFDRLYVVALNEAERSFEVHPQTG
jgi:predicted kinase